MGRPENPRITELENAIAVVLSGIDAVDNLRLFVRKLARRGLNPELTKEGLELVATAEAGLETARELLAIERTECTTQRSRKTR